MAVSSEVKNLKVVIKLEKGSQTVSDCSKTATNEGLYSVGKAVAGLLNEQFEEVLRVEESYLIKE